jgi:tyrosyl-DNA phosphodiesterase-1
VPTRDIPGNVPEVVMQVSSMATFTDKWLINTLLKTLDTSSSPPKTVDHKVVFPTANDIRRSLDGYNSGHSIHTKVPNGKYNKQLLCMKPLFYHWAGDGGNYDGEAFILFL